MMFRKIRKIIGWCFAATGGLFALALLAGGAGDFGLWFIAVFMVAGGASMIVGPKSKHGVGAYTTKNCPECETHILLDAATCPECGKKQKAKDSTCSGGVNTAADGRSDFAGERRNAKTVGSPGYIWRTAQDGAVCERCAANNGHKFPWDNEPPGGHAGAKARCRCYPEAIIPKG